MRRLLPLLLAACVRTEVPDPQPPPPASPALPEGFAVRGAPEVHAPFLEPEAAWRFVLSRLTTLRAEARALGEPSLVTFEAKAFHVTERSGRRRTWRLPPGLRLLGGPVQVVFAPDLTHRIYGPDGAQIEDADEVTVVSARVAGEGVDVHEIRLLSKGGRGFRSISTAGTPD